ncbi:MAG: hypothetical protein ACRDCW_12150 [Sarcina sp.]
MKIKVKLNNENYIEGYASIGNIEDSIEVILQNELISRKEEYQTKWNGVEKRFELTKLVSYTEDVCEDFANNYSYYKLENGILIFDENKKIRDELELKIKSLETKIIEKTIELENVKNSMFLGTQKEIELQKELNNLKQKYLDLNHELALQVENKLK